jgi:hypothetical protein
MVAAIPGWADSFMEKTERIVAKNKPAEKIVIGLILLILDICIPNYKLTNLPITFLNFP